MSCDEVGRHRDGNDTVSENESTQGDEHRDRYEDMLIYKLHSNVIM